MKISKSFIILTVCGFLLISMSSCRVWNNMFGPKYGCPGDGKAVGAERILSGEKVPKAKKFRS